MRRLMNLTVATTGMFTFLAVAVYGFRDHSVFISPPEAVAQDFIHGVVAHRFGPALKHLEPQLSKEVGMVGLKTVAHTIESRVGRVVLVPAEQLAIADDSARVRTVISGATGNTYSIDFRLTSDPAGWRILEMR